MFWAVIVIGVPGWCAKLLGRWGRHAGMMWDVLSAGGSGIWSVYLRYVLDLVATTPKGVAVMSKSDFD